MGISLCMVVMNERKNIERFLLHHKFDETVVVDTGSTDDTAPIAGKYAKVFNFKWNDDFSAARNFSVSKATQEWILWLDADEWIESNDMDRIRELTNEGFMGFSFLQKTYTNNIAHPRFVPFQKDYYKGYYVRRICKLFRNSGIMFEYPVHETVKNSIIKKREKIKKTDIVIEHFPRESIYKSEYYYLLLEKKMKEFPESNAGKEMEVEKGFLQNL